MVFTRMTNVEGMETILGINVKFYFNYKEGDIPKKVKFVIENHEGMRVYGTCTSEGIENYNVLGGIISQEMLSSIEVSAFKILSEYETI